jgi:hypothetical protein
MKRLAFCLLSLSLLLAATPLAAKENQPQYKAIVVNHFTNSNGTSQSQDFINYFADSLSAHLQKLKIAGQVLGEGVAVAPADAADSLLIEGKFTSFDKGGMFATGKLGVEMNIYRVSDHALVRTITNTLAFKSSPFNKDKNVAEFAGGEAAYLIKQGLKNINLSSIAPAPPPAANPSPVAAATPPAAQAFVSIDSTPPDADIEIDGAFVGNTPSTVAVAPGSHRIAVKKTGFADWNKTLNVTGGTVRLNAELVPAPPKQ